MVSAILELFTSPGENAKTAPRCPAKPINPSALALPRVLVGLSISLE
jgi:hypothetical protein